jgi:hypothetical protein
MVSDTAAEEGSQGDNTSLPADLLTFATNCQSSDHMPPAHLAKLMSDEINNHTSKGSNTQMSMLVLHFILLHLLCIRFLIVIDAYGEALINSSSNGGLAGKEMHVIKTYDNGRTVDIEGIG